MSKTPSPQNTPGGAPQPGATPLTNNTPRSNPFSSAFAASASGGSGARPSSSPGNFLSRFGTRSTVDYLPMHDLLLMFDLYDITPAAYYMFDIAPPSKEEGAVDTADSKALISIIERDKAVQERMRTALNAYWDGVRLVGAVHVYDWREEVKQAVTNRLNAIKQPPRYVRASDPLLVLNILARARTSLLIHGAALALDRPFLERVVMTDDPRLVQLASASRLIEDSFVPPPPPPDNLFNDEDDDK
ncbi:MAG: hypothetical protein SF162_00680 [bacterium]|nr:hypothetical protein [bacterium]